MSNVTTTTVRNSLYAAAFAGVLAFTGCSAGQLTGPEAEAPEAPSIEAQAAASGVEAPHNDSNNGGGSTERGARHNTSED